MECEQWYGCILLAVSVHATEKSNFRRLLRMLRLHRLLLYLKANDYYWDSIDNERTFVQLLGITSFCASHMSMTESEVRHSYNVERNIVALATEVHLCAN